MVMSAILASGDTDAHMLNHSYHSWQQKKTPGSHLLDLFTLHTTSTVSDGSISWECEYRDWGGWCMRQQPITHSNLPTDVDTAGRLCFRASGQKSCYLQSGSRLLLLLLLLLYASLLFSFDRAHDRMCSENELQQPWLCSASTACIKNSNRRSLETQGECVSVHDWHIFVIVSVSVRDYWVLRQRLVCMCVNSLCLCMSFLKWKWIICGQKMEKV